MKRKSNRPMTRSPSYFLLLAILTSSLPVASAASFACSKAKGTVEKLICSNAGLSRLDDELNRAYVTESKSAEKSAELVNDQRRWIVEDRNKCTNAECLSHAYQARISWLQNRAGRGASPCEVNEAGIVGSWHRLKGGDFEELAFAIDGMERSFISWLRHKPEFTGTWELKACVLHIAHNHSRALDFDYRIKGLRGDVLYLKNTDDGEESSYRKIDR
jgi:uncharacterized protein